MQDEHGQQPQRGLDLTAIAVIAALMALTAGWYFIYYVPAMRDYQVRVAAYEKLKAEKEAAKRAADAAAVDTERKPAKRPAGEPANPEGEADPAAADEPPPQMARNPHVAAIPLVTEDYRATLNTAGASLDTLTFKDILETTYAPVQSAEADRREAQPLTLLKSYLPGVRSFAIEPLDEKLSAVATADWAHQPLEGGGHEFSLRLDNDLVLRKRFLPPQPAPKGEAGASEDDEQRLYHFDLEVEVENTSSEPRSFGYYLNGPAGMVEQDVGRQSYGQQSLVALRDETGEVKLNEETTSGFENIGTPDQVVRAAGPVEIAYYGLASKYFAGVVIPKQKAGTRIVEAQGMGLLQKTGKQPTEAQREDLFGLGHQGVARGLVPEQTIPPGKSMKQQFMVYAGPRQEREIFEQPVYEGYGLGELVYFGWAIFGGMARFLTWILSGFQQVVGNWGVAILLLTFVVRGLMMPLSMWSQKNMLSMQKLAPEINKLKEKFSKKDGSMTPEQQRAFQAAQMDLWRKHGVNPIGCVGPIFLQMPIFIGLYNALSYSSAVRDQGFMLWISDLSQPDVLFRLPFTIPILGTNAFSVLPLVMVATYILQQRMQPKPTDEKQAEQQRMMRWLFPLFGLLFYTMPSGLMLYFITSSAWGMAEQKVIKKRLEEQEAGGAVPAKA